MDAFSPNSAPTALPIHKNRHFLLIFLIVLTLISLGTTGYLLLQNAKMATSLSSTASNKALISGTFDINGVIPSEAIVILKRTDVASPNNTITLSQGFSATDQGSWSLDNAIAGKTYTITASIVSQGQTIATSDPIEVTAPASNEIIVLNLPISNPKGTAVISGNIHIDGYIPQAAMLTIKGRILGKTNYTTIASNLPGNPTQFMSYASAIAGQTYEVIGILTDSSGKQIGISPTLEVTAPALNESLTINSQAAPPTPSPQSATPTPTPLITTMPSPTPIPTPAMISGSINFNGIAPVNSRIVIFQKVYNSPNYEVAVNNVTPIDGTTWQWTGARLATWYDIVAILKQTQPDGTDKDIAISQMQSVAAPGTNVILTINSGIVLSAPNGTISANCGNLSNNIWNGQISYSSVSGAQSYWMEIGSAEGSNDILNVIQNTNNQSNQTVNVNLTNGITYYARYAYATNPNAGKPQFSPFSATTQFKCSQ